MATNYKKCPYCAERIKAEAIVCRYCGRNLPQPDRLKRKKPGDSQQMASVWGVGRAYAFWIGTISLFAIPINRLSFSNRLPSENLAELIPLTVTGTIANYLITIGTVALVTWINRSGRWLLALALLALLFGGIYVIRNSGNENQAVVGAPDATITAQVTSTITYDNLTGRWQIWASGAIPAYLGVFTISQAGDTISGVSDNGEISISGNVSSDFRNVTGFISEPEETPDSFQWEFNSARTSFTGFVFRDYLFGRQVTPFAQTWCGIRLGSGISRPC